MVLKDALTGTQAGTGFDSTGNTVYKYGIYMYMSLCVCVHVEREKEGRETADENLPRYGRLAPFPFPKNKNPNPTQKTLVWDPTPRFSILGVGRAKLPLWAHLHPKTLFEIWLNT